MRAKLFTGPQTAIKKEIEGLRSDASILPGEKKNLRQRASFTSLIFRSTLCSLQVS